MLDIIYTVYFRPEFTRASLDELIKNTFWPMVDRFIVYVNGATPELEIFIARSIEDLNIAQQRTLGHIWPVKGYTPVQIMKHYLHRANIYFAKIDNDVVVPPRWLQRCMAVILKNPKLDLLGIEPALSRTASPHSGKIGPRPELETTCSACSALDVECMHQNMGYAACDAVGGIGVFRSGCFYCRAPMIAHSIYGGFTDWQLRHKDLNIGWIKPPLNLFLLDRLHFPPWKQYSEEYISKGWQRPWTDYTDEEKELWEWWLHANAKQLSLSDSVAL